MADVAAARVPVLDADPFSLDVLLNPYPFQEQLREHAPVSYITPYNAYVTGRYHEVKTVLNDWQSFTSIAGAGLSDIRKPGAWRQPGPIVESEPPDHTEIRQVLRKIISPKVIRGWQIEFDTYAATLAERIVAQGEVNAAKAIAEDFVLTVFPASLGLPAHPENLIIVGNFNFNALGPKNALFEDSAAKLAGIMDWFEATQDRGLVASGSFSDQVYAAEDAGLIKPGVARGLVRTMLRGGMDTTISGIGSTLLMMARHPELWARLRQDRAAVKLVFDETLRLETPIQSYFRTTTRPVELGGLTLEPETKIQIFVGAANRDPRQWRNPAAFDLNRPTGEHLAFGGGIHVCIGMMIARMEAEAVLNALLDRVARIDLTGTPTYRPSNALRTLQDLPLRFIAAT